MATQTNILYTNTDSTIFILDIPKSIELAQSLPSKRRLISSPPLERPYASLEPKTAKARAKFPKPSVEELLLQRHIQFALEEVKEVFERDWCLERVFEREGGEETRGMKRWRVGNHSEIKNLMPDINSPILKQEVQTSPTTLFFQNPTSSPNTILISAPQSSSLIPPNSTLLLGSISSTIPTLLLCAPTFNLIILDPPWPNRSARRSKQYSTSPDIHSLLSSLPIQEKLADNGVVAVWITNKKSFREMICSEGGLFEKWGLDVVEEWVWVKVTKNGELVGGLDDVWRKPWEVLMVGKRKKSSNGNKVSEDEIDARGIKRRIIFAVPDLHSRKPNLKELMERCLGLGGLGLVGGEKGGKKAGGYEALEVFARNMTAGWWSWGDEAGTFQSEEFWMEEAA